MRYFLSLLAVLAFVGTAQADEPKRLTDAEMDRTTAGYALPGIPSGPSRDRFDTSRFDARLAYLRAYYGI